MRSNRHWRLRRLYATIPAVQFGPKCLKAIQGHLAAENLARSYVNDLVDTIRRSNGPPARRIIPVTTWQEALTTVPGLKKGRCKARETAPVLPVDDATVDATLPHLRPVLADMVRFQRLVGC